jgi:hypothetical protein
VDGVYLLFLASEDFAWNRRAVEMGELFRVPWWAFNPDPAELIDSCEVKASVFRGMRLR